LERGDLGQRWEVIGVRHRPQHRLGGLEATVKAGAVVAQGQRPAVVVEHPRLGTERHVRVDE